MIPSPLNVVSFALAAVILAGCASQPMLYTKQVPQDQQTIIGVIRNRLENVRIDNRKTGEVFLSPQYIIQADGTGRFQIVVQVKQSSDEFLIIKPGSSLTLRLDNKSQAFDTRLGSGPRRVVVKRLGMSSYSESAVYDRLTKRDMQRILHARKIHVKVSGVNGVLTGEFSDQNFAAFEAVLEKAAEVSNSRRALGT